MIALRKKRTAQSVKFRSAKKAMKKVPTEAPTEVPAVA